MAIFYGWRIVFAGGALQFLQSMLLNQAFGAYLAVLVEDRGWSKTAISGAAALKSTEAALLGPVLGWMVDRFGSQGMIRAGVLIFGVGFMILSQVNTLVEFYAAFVVLALGASMCSNFPVSITIIQWFERQRARALSATQTGQAFGGLVVFVVAWALQTYGWRVTAFASGIAVIVIGWPLARIIRSRPEDHGLTVDGLPPQPREDQHLKVAHQRAFSTREALRTSAFWLLSLGHGFSLFVVTAINVHAIAHIRQGLGYSIAQASLIITLCTAGQFIGVMLGWMIGDKFEKRLVAAACMLMHAVGLLMLTYANGMTMLVVSALIHGTGWGLRGPLMSAIRADYFGRSSIGMITGISSIVMLIGQIGGPMVAGVFADITGNYRLGFTILAVLAGVGSLFFVMAKPPKLKPR